MKTTYLDAVQKIIDYSAPFSPQARLELLNAANDCDEASHAVGRAVEELSEAMDYVHVNRVRAYEMRKLDIAEAVVRRADELRKQEIRFNAARDKVATVVSTVYGLEAKKRFVMDAEPNPRSATGAQAQA